MRFLFPLLSLVLLSHGMARAHGDISALPDSVQILQYKMVLYTDSEDLATKNLLAMAYFRTKALDEASVLLDEIIAKDPNNFDAMDGRGIVLLKQGRGNEALDYLNRALAINDKDVMIHAHLAAAHAQLKRPDLAALEMELAGQLAETPEMRAEIQEEIKRVSKP